MAEHRSPRIRVRRPAAQGTSSRRLAALRPPALSVSPDLASRLPPRLPAATEATYERQADEVAAAATRGERLAPRGPARPLPASSAGASPSAGTGRELDGSVRRDLQTLLGHDLSRVRIHADGEAAALAAGVGARAFTVGSDLFFAAGRYAPRTAWGCGLLAHEVAHVVQQAHDPRAAGRLQRSEEPKVDAENEEDAESKGDAEKAEDTPAKPSGIVSTDLARLQEVLTDWQAKLSAQGVSSPFVLEPVEGTDFHRIAIEESAKSRIESEAERVDNAADEAGKGVLGKDRTYPLWVLRVGKMALSDVSFDLSFIASAAEVIPRAEGGETKRVSMDNPTGDPLMARVQELARQAQAGRLAGDPDAVEKAQQQLEEEQAAGPPKSVETAGVTVPTKAMADKAVERTLEMLMAEYDKALATETAKAKETDELSGNSDFTAGRLWAQKSRQQVRTELAAVLAEQRSKNVEPGPASAVQVFIDRQVGTVGGGGPATDLLSGEVDLGELVAHELAIHGVVYLPGSRSTWLVPLSDGQFVTRNLDRVQQNAYKKLQQEHGVADSQHHWILEVDLEFEAAKPEPEASSPSQAPSK